MRQGQIATQPAVPFSLDTPFVSDVRLAYRRLPLTIKALEQRLTAVEAELTRKVAEPKPQRDWRKTIGAFSGDDGMMEIFEEARKLREADRAKARKYRTKRTRRS